jgi:beta-lactam-binding protein with PASTA domain
MMAAISIAATVLAFALAACGSQTSTSPSTVTITQHSAFAEPSAASTSAMPSQITVPEVKGQNAEIVRKNLEKLGLTDVNLSSANPKYGVVVLASNWTAVSIEPPPGTVVSSDDPVVVKVYKD